MECRACGRRGGFEDFFGNHWLKPDGDRYKRCKDCVKEGKFNHSGSWCDTPKPPCQILWERGWLDPDVEGKGKEAVDAKYPPEEVGRMIVNMSDSALLLSNFEIAGHYGYGGLHEGLCCYPGCLKESGLSRCGKCGCARYCGRAHQVEHWKLHKRECKRIERVGAYHMQAVPIACVKCEKTNRVRYGYVPDSIPGPWMHEGKGGRLMCGKCASHLGIQLTEWVYSNPKNIDA